jgi:hypothetical protein
MLEIIINSSLFSGLLGTFIGGMITLMVTKYSLNKQLNNQKILKEEQEKYESNKAIEIVCYEFIHNMIRLIDIKNIIIEANVKSMIQLNNYAKLISNDYWNEYKFKLWSHEDKKVIMKLEYFYFNLAPEINLEVSSIERIEQGIAYGLKNINLIKKYIKITDHELEKIEKSNIEE